MAHPPRSKPPLRSSSGPPSPCITPSTETLVLVVSFMVGAPFSLVSFACLDVLNHGLPGAAQRCCRRGLGLRADQPVFKRDDIRVEDGGVGKFQSGHAVALEDGLPSVAAERDRMDQEPETV